ncbi:MAG: hypothetical protein IIT67_08035 [Clostridia bacterium]|nr:hypothetical protein [Clostridia bacterium]
MSNTPSLRQRMIDLPVNGDIVVSLDVFKMSTVRSYVSDLNFTMGRTYTCRRDRATRSYTITRIA